MRGKAFWLLAVVILLGSAIAITAACAGKGDTNNYYFKIGDDDATDDDTGDDDSTPDDDSATDDDTTADDDTTPDDDDTTPADDDTTPVDDDTTSDDDVWTDSSSGLMWQNGATVGTAWFNMQSAEYYCTFLIWGGYGGWRVPDIDELRSLVRGCDGTETGGDCGVTDECESQSCDNAACYGCSYLGGPGPGGAYWPPELSGPVDYPYRSLSPIWGTNDSWWVMNFDLGSVNFGLGDDSEYVRCVR
jgi:hypothetical protein